MAPPESSRPVEEETVVFIFKPTDDHFLTCLICGKNNCDLESTASQNVHGLGHARVTVGKHSKCTRKDITLR